MSYARKIVDRQVGRNAELFAHAIAEYPRAEDRYAFLRILVSIIEQAHPEWNQTSQKDRQIAHLVQRMAPHMLDSGEIAEVVRVRDEERGYFKDG